MIDATIKITVSPEKRTEILQTFRAILDPIRLERGCLSCHCYVDIEAENTLFFREEWRSRDDLESHLRSAIFCVLAGAMGLLERPPEVSFNFIAAAIGMEAVQATRGSLMVEQGGYCPPVNWWIKSHDPQEE